MANKADIARQNGKKGGRPRGAKSQRTVIRETGERRALQKAIASEELSATRVLEEMRRLSFSDVRNLFDERGNLRPLHTLSADDAACVAGLEVIIKNAKAGDGQTDTIHKIKIWDKPRVLEMLAKHFALLTEVVRIDDEQGRIARLQAARKRVSESRAAHA